MPSPRTHVISQRAAIDASAELTYQLVADTTLWPCWFEPAVHAECLSSGPGWDVVRRWVRTGDTVKAWTSRRELDPAGRRITYDQVDTAPPLASSRVEWVFAPQSTSTVIVEVRHEFSLVDDDPVTAAQVAERTEANSQRQLDAVEAAAEQRPHLSDRTLSTHDSAVVAGPLPDVYEYLSTIDVDGTRIGLPSDRIAVKYREPGAGMAARLGHWHLAETSDGVLVTARQIAVVAPEPARMPHDRIRQALRAEASRILRQARAYAGLRLTAR